MVDEESGNEVEFDLGDVVAGWVKEQLTEMIVELREFLNSLGVVLVLDEDTPLVNDEDLYSLLEEGFENDAE